MKKYEEPSIEVITISVTSEILQSSIELHDEIGDGTTGQLAPGKKDWNTDDNDVDTGFGW